MFDLLDNPVFMGYAAIAGLLLYILFIAAVLGAIGWGFMHLVSPKRQTDKSH